MARSFPAYFALLTWLACRVAADGQLSPSLPSAIVPAKSAQHISIGQSVTTLFGPWKFRLGDSPINQATHAPLWAEPGFDDSQWETVSLAPKYRGDERSEESDSVPGWTASGHAGYWGYAWYRVRLQIDTRPGEKLALNGPSDVDDAYEVFLNGKALGGFGDFTKSRPVTYYNQPMMFQMNRPSAGSSISPVEVLAFRVWMDPNTLATTADAGGLRSAPMVGDSQAIADRHELAWLALIRQYSPFVITALLFGLLALVAFSLILFDRSDKVYLWMGAVFLLTAIYSGMGAFAVWTQHLSILADSLITQSFLIPLAYSGWVVVWWLWFGRQRPGWLPEAGAGLALLYMISNAIAVELFFSLIPHPVAMAFEIVSLIVRLFFFALLLWIVVQGIRRHGREGWLVLPAIVLLGIGLFQNESAVLHIQLNWSPFGVRIALAQVANLLLVTALALLLLRRLLLSVRRQRLIALDAKRAQLQSDFVAAVSHEFRSPLTTLRTITDLLAQNRIPDEARRKESYVFLDRETTRLQRLVEDLLDFGRMESGRKQYRLECHDAYQLVRDTVADFIEQAQANGFSVEASLAPAEDYFPPRVQVDDEAFRRALRNLLENAMKYSPECRTVWVDGAIQGHKVLISVRDRGMGIDAEEEEAIFQKFVRGHAAKKAGIKGTGIGLAMVRQISEAMGGEIRLQSEVGVGSTFTIVLPLSDK